MKKVLTFAIGFCLAASAVFAHGKKDVVERDVEKMESYQEYFDINDSKPGKYNIMVTAKDKGGNTAFGGPYNIYIDPESDLPISGITNPLNNMRIPGNLNIVGTCIDDDGVGSVELILDGDTENPVKAIGKEFWSYYLDTTNLSEGPHTIEVYGTDVNGLKGKSKKVTWNLDRRQPVTKVTNYGLGELVSGKINFKGTISDGNGIKSLTYSLDNGEHFYDAKISEEKGTGNWIFDVPVDTKLFKDGPTVIWFKATDKTGSVGVYSFLYFIDNTVPDIKIVTPAEKDVQNGIFTITGFAKDTVGIKKLEWTFGNEKGEFELIPGNPYWYKEVNTIGLGSAKEVTFTISGIDVAGNIQTVKRVIPLNQEMDKPVVSIDAPANAEIVEGEKGTLFVRGIVTDDDGVAAAYVKLDNDEEIEVPCEGVFYLPLAAEKDISFGTHKITVYAKDIHGVKGNPVTATFNAKGNAPKFAASEIKGGNNAGAVKPGIMVHPESGAVFQTTAAADCGIAKISYNITWGKSGSKTGEIVPPKGAEKSLTLSIPASDLPWGLVRIEAVAEDVYGRNSVQTSVLNLMNLNRLYADEPKVVFDDSSVVLNDEGQGVIFQNENFPASGYFVGGNAKSVDIVPATPFAKASLVGNSIVFSYGNSVGTSKPVVVRVTTDQNLTYDSIPLVFQTDVAAPEVEIPAATLEPVNGYENINIQGTVKSEVPVNSLKYRLFASRASMNGTLVTSMSVPGTTELRDVELKGSGFNIDIPSEDLPEGVYAVEVIADNGKKSSNVVFVNKLPEKPDTTPDGKSAVAMKPFVAWFDGNDVYSYIAFQGTMSDTCAVYKRSEMAAGNTDLSVAYTDNTGKPAFSKYTTKKDGGMKSFFVNVNGSNYESGKEIIIAKGGSSKITALVESDFPVLSASYKIEGSGQPGGNSTQSGKAVVTSAGDKMYNVEVPLANLPVGVTKIEVTSENGKTPASKTVGTVVVLRDINPETDDVRKVYWTPGEDVSYDDANGWYVLKAGESFNAYANVSGPVVAVLNSSLTAGTEVEGNSIFVKPIEEGIYKGITLTVKDSQGISYTTEPVTLLVDSERPLVEIESPAKHLWVQNSATLTATASDKNGIINVEYSLDKGNTWNRLKKTGEKYTTPLNLELYDEGLIAIDVKATDAAGRETTARTVIQKDVTPPEATVIIPCAEDIVNGENYIVFAVKDNGKFVQAQYQAPASGKTVPAPVELPMASAIATLLGTQEEPISDLMSFNFIDAAGNVNKFLKYDFIIDNESDLPKAEVHLPQENDVLTRDFEISGVIYDDDGPCKLWYKFDNGEYQLLPQEGTSFSMQIPLQTFNDNEHKITVYAEDIHGVKGPEFVRNFRISLEEPKGEVKTPPISETVREMVTLTGVATDKNGIGKVYVSLDNGNSFNEAEAVYGHDKTVVDWKYTLDTRVIQDGTHVVFLKIVDWYGIEGLYSSLINIDNTAPEISLELPLDDSKTTGTLFFSGYTSDNIKLTDLFITIRSLEGKSISQSLSRTELVPDSIITKAIDISELPDGFYNIEMTGKDAANNITRVSRNVQLDKKAPVAKVDMLYPLNGEKVQGVFNIYGTAVGEKQIAKVLLFVDNAMAVETDLSASGYYKFNLGPETLTNGRHTIKTQAILEDGTAIVSNEQYIFYDAVGPWVTIDNFTYGDFAIERPYIIGNAGYTVDEEELLASKAKDATREFKERVALKAVEKVEISFNNGKSFEQVSKSGKWRYRVENTEMKEGYHFLLVRATMKNGEVAVTRTIVQIDKTAPTVRLISPGEGGHFNQMLDFSGLTRDNVALERVTLSLRKGDKASYEVPSFIQGLYFDWQFWGASLFNIGAGLTFFNDNVKLQFQWGQFTRDQWKTFKGSENGYRYGGDNILGIKLLANVFYLPFNYFFGPDLDWLSANLALGANFSYFSDSGAGKGQFLSALLAQLEFPRVTLEKQKMFRTIAFYTEGQFWFCPSDVGGSSDNDIPTVVPQISFGLRVNLF